MNYFKNLLETNALHYLILGSCAILFFISVYDDNRIEAPTPSQKMEDVVVMKKENAEEVSNYLKC